MKVLIYGYGWSGQSALSLFGALGFECYVVDEKLDTDTIVDKRFIALKEALSQSFDLILVCIVNEEVAREVAKKLYKQGISKDRVRYFQTYSYQEKMSRMLKHFFGSAEEVLQDCLSESLTMPLLHSKILALQNAYFKDKRDSAESLAQWGDKIRAKFPNQSIFSMLYTTSIAQKSLGHIAYPGFNIIPSQDKTEDKNFYFIQEVDFESLKNRPKDVKLIACFGNSALRTEYLPLENTITYYLQKHLGSEKFIVVNFGVSGYTTYEQIMLYNALIYPLKPEIVLSFFAGTDFRISYVCCDYLLKKHNIIYSPYFNERPYKIFANSDLPLYCELGTSNKVNPAIQDKEIIGAILERLEQFYLQVVRGGGAIPCLYPAFTSLQVRMEQRRERNAS
ncbi:hypothetical protein [uncultured Helicobacter sp.]|uniref:hypothetical protein n=1 Tax=uncultured Helicobacter sp. TaxID=175537 RepID=UPI0026190064|nr:hypothetical protein [uncultured Helicobacter sp.]